MSGMPTQSDDKRSTTPQFHKSKDGSADNETIQWRTRNVRVLQSVPFLVAARKQLTLIAGLLLTCSPTIYLYSLEASHDYHRRTDLNILMWTYTLTSTVGITAAMLIQAILAYLLAFLCFNGHTNASIYLAETMKTEDDIKDEAHRKRRREMSRRRGYWIFMLLFSFVVAGLVEEWIKYVAITTMLALAPRSSHGRGINSERDLITVAVSAGLGFATVENIAFFFAAARRHKAIATPTAKQESQEGAMFALLTALERMVMGIPGHAMTAALIGANILVRDHHLRHDDTSKMGAWPILRNSVFFHGSSNFFLFAVSAAAGNVGWVLPRKARTVCFVLVVLAGLQAALALVLRARLRRCGLW